mmetsp:Transcript_4440/g.6484  ORF Transcript_4440/g.6484 Transcript_4440/m.6484 type:complete len:544 (-) Transcript_4440:1688-3319(-)
MYDEEDLHLLNQKRQELEEKVRWFHVRKRRRDVLKKVTMKKTISTEEKEDDLKKNEKQEVAQEVIDLVDDGDHEGKSVGKEKEVIDLVEKEEAKDDKKTTTKTADTNKKRKRVSFGTDVASDAKKKNAINGPKDNDDSPSPLPPFSFNKETKEEEKEEDDPTEELNRIRIQYKEAMDLEQKAMVLRKKIFSSRILSRTDVGDLGREVKSLKRMFPCGGIMAAIVDDREDVWANAENNSTGRPGEPPENLLLVKPYHWKEFSGCRDVNNAAGMDLSASSSASLENGSKKKNHGEGEANDSNNNNEEKDEQQLLWTMDILKRIHERYYSDNLTDDERQTLSVPQILKEMRREVFGGCSSSGGGRKIKILLSGLVPLYKQKSFGEGDQKKPRPSVVRYAEDLGATIVSEATPDLTYVVAARDGTEKVLRARRMAPHCFVVRPSWLMECYWSITKRDVVPHIIGPMPKQRPPPPLLLQQPERGNIQMNQERKSILLTGTDSSDEEIDVGAAPDKESILLDGTDSSDDEDDDDFAAELENEIMASRNA